MKEGRGKTARENVIKNMNKMWDVRGTAAGNQTCERTHVKTFPGKQTLMAKRNHESAKLGITHTIILTVFT